MEPNQGHFKLPTAVVDQNDVAKIIAEIDKFDEFMRQARIRKVDEAKIPQVSKSLSAICEIGKINLLRENERQNLYQALELIKDKAPRLHISFAAEPSEVVRDKVVNWFRQEIHPMSLISFGLQPNLGAGCVVRGPNKYFDFSLRQHLDKQRMVLINKITGGNPA